MTDFIPVGRVGKPHGLDGAFVVEQGSEDPRRFDIGRMLYLEGQPAEIIVSRRVGGRRPAIKLDRDVTRGQVLDVRVDDLPPADAESYYVFQLVGLEVIAEDGAWVGRVQDVLPGVANDNLVLDSGLLVPMIDEAIRGIDLDTGHVHVNPDFAV